MPLTTIFITLLKVVAWVVLVHVTKTLEKSCSFFSLRWLTHNVSSKPPNCPFLSSVGLEAADSDRWTSFHQQKLDRTLKHVQTSFFSPSPLWLTSPLVFFSHPLTSLCPSILICPPPTCLSVPGFQSLVELWQPVDEKHRLAAGAVEEPDSVQLSF